MTNMYRVRKIILLPNTPAYAMSINKPSFIKQHVFAMLTYNKPILKTCKIEKALIRILNSFAKELHERGENRCFSSYNMRIIKSVL